MSDYPVVPGAVNISYGSANELVYTDDAGETHIYSPGDIAWVLCSTALGASILPSSATKFTERLPLNHSMAYDSRSWILLRWPAPSQERPATDGSGCGHFGCRFI